MSMFDDIAQVFVDCAGITTAVDRLMKLRQQFNALAPDWSEAPEWAQWCAIDAGGDQCWYAGEPHAGDGANAWMSADGQYEVCRELSIPIGIDWRLCKWQRP